MELVEQIKNAWGWTGIEPLQVIGENDFGNLMVCDQQGQYWRICPEDLYCKLIATDRTALAILIEDEDFQEDWNMRSMIEEAQAKLGPLASGRKYCLKIPGPLGGEYGGTNLASISLRELVTLSGYIALQIRDLPDGAQVRFQITN